MIRHILTDDHKEHFKQVGIPVGEHVEVDSAEYKEHYANWKRTLPDATHEELHKRALAHASWLDHAGQTKPAVPAPDVVSEIKAVDPQAVTVVCQIAWPRWVEWWAVAVLVILLFGATRAHSQVSKLSSITTQQAGVSNGFFAYPFTINCSTGMVCSTSGSVFTLTASGGDAATLGGHLPAYFQPALSLLPGTYADGKACTYTAAGTLLNCNTSFATGTGTASGTNTGDQTITLTGDVTGSGTGSFAATIASNKVTYAKMQQTGAGSVLLGNPTGSAANVSKI